MNKRNRYASLALVLIGFVFYYYHRTGDATYLTVLSVWIMAAPEKLI